MKVQSLLALLPFLSLALADADQAWKDVCEASPPKDKVTINGVEFKYTCDRSCDRNSIVEITGTFDHPDKCAEQITSSPEELITWRKDAQKCWKCTAPTTAPNSYMILVMQKEDDPFGPPTPPPSTAQQLADCKSQLKACNAKLNQGGGDVVVAVAARSLTPLRNVRYFAFLSFLPQQDG
jgi:hypothetical protein